jgi:hypothetical protein
MHCRLHNATAKSKNWTTNGAIFQPRHSQSWNWRWRRRRHADATKCKELNSQRRHVNHFCWAAHHNVTFTAEHKHVRQASRVHVFISAHINAVDSVRIQLVQSASAVGILQNRFPLTVYGRSDFPCLLSTARLGYTSRVCGSISGKKDEKCIWEIPRS